MAMEQWGERVRHEVIDTALEPVFGRARRARAWLKVWQHPELEAVFLSEPAAIEALLERLVTDGMCCVDVGAHIGSVTALLQRLSPSGRHLAVEPTPYKAEWLRNKYPSVDVVECAVGNGSGRVTFHFHTAASGYSSLRSPDLAGRKSLEVELRRLDDVVPEDRTVGFLKVDVEGGELDVFRGAQRIIGRDRPTILFECTLTGLDAFEQTPAEMHRFLTREGYQIFTPIDLLHDHAALDEAAFDRATRYPFRAFNFIAIPASQQHGGPPRDRGAH